MCAYSINSIRFCSLGQRRRIEAGSLLHDDSWKSGVTVGFPSSFSFHFQRGVDVLRKPTLATGGSHGSCFV